MYRIIEELSAIVNKLLEIVKEQSKLLEMADIPQDTVQKLSDKKKDIDIFIKRKKLIGLEIAFF